MKRILPIAAAAMLAACVTGDWERMLEEFSDVRRNCGLSTAELERDGSDRHLLRLVFHHGSDMRQQAQDDGRFSCVELWANERGYRLDTAGANRPLRQEKSK
jgi:hypothetical protein